ncbi:MAG: hypothetical protein HN778_11420 [Prolixibacteraceae bacterium]|jgi:hypothetical protein|nr:hypothetical protein [Prolixibacteraceae bacterium]MBT6007481.1 hypothetical protein [Prolixibacteraceae bacterium]MBT6766617.1 hypothetical protein [Prolixibacteraceae bacterium]MBT6999344.1 hypothetical protein [Prolixibacteraceae bacterium]MBT7395433.1 hypothetical protein [Prolixibacteraceae bacterium]
MKTVKLIFVLIFVFGILNSYQARSQAIIIRDNTINFIAKNPDTGLLEYFPSISSRTTLSASGTIVKTATFELYKNHFLIPEKGINIIGVRIEVETEEGQLVDLTDEKVEIRQSGVFKVILHLNGAGTNLPVGWQ